MVQNYPLFLGNKKVPIHFEDGTGDGFHPVSVEDHYRLQYYEALDSTIAGINNRFNQPGYVMYKSVENLLLNAANKTPFEEHFKQVMDLYKDDFDSNLLSAQLQIFSTAIKTEAIGTVTRTSVSLRDCIQFLCDLSPAKNHFSVKFAVRLNWCKLCQLLMRPAKGAFQQCVA